MLVPGVSIILWTQQAVFCRKTSTINKSFESSSTWKRTSLSRTRHSPITKSNIYGCSDWLQVRVSWLWQVNQSTNKDFSTHFQTATAGRQCYTSLFVHSERQLETILSEAARPSSEQCWHLTNNYQQLTLWYQIKKYIIVLLFIIVIHIACLKMKRQINVELATIKPSLMRISH